jgi:LysR family transcriptional activator of nhaA
MEWLNYHHLLYFWTVARAGSAARASEELRLTQATVSAQLKSLEQSLGEKLFRKAGRHLVLTDTGKLVFRYADEIFSLGQEMIGSLKGRPEGRLARLTVGVVDVLPKLVAYQLIEPALHVGPQASPSRRARDFRCSQSQTVGLISGSTRRWKNHG